MTDALHQIKAERAKIAQERAALDQRDAELAVAERVLAGLAVSAPPSPSAEPTTASARLPRGSRRDRVIEALTVSPEVWLTSREISDAIARLNGEAMKDSSLFPMLTNLKDEGVIVRENNKLALASRIQGEAAI